MRITSHLELCISHLELCISHLELCARQEAEDRAKEMLAVKEEEAAQMTAMLRAREEASEQAAIVSGVAIVSIASEQAASARVIDGR